MSTAEKVKTFTIYCVTNVKNNKRYIGQTCYEPTSRWKKHVWLANHGGCNRFYEAIREYGSETFKIATLEANLSTGEEANVAEKKWIAELMTQNPEFGYNSTEGGDQRTGSSWKQSPEAIEKARLSKIGKPLMARRVKTDEKHRPIVEAFKSGETRAQIAEEFSLTQHRVIKILLRWKAYHEPDLPVGAEHQYKSSGKSLQIRANQRIRLIVADLLTGMSYKDVAEKHTTGYGNVKTIVSRLRTRHKEFQVPDDHPILIRRKNQHA